MCNGGDVRGVTFGTRVNEQVPLPLSYALRP